MKTIKIALLLLVYASCGGSKERSANDEYALMAVKKESKVVDATITDAGVLYAAVHDDGTRRDGYAEYLCQLLKEYRAEAGRVKVVAAGSMNSSDRDNAYGRLLGESWCR
ncbi:hypothetical protein [Niabella aurantiaca]|uniref:hypothetical protein n=1 Tax=Niabella aurantiaca TaxID=379900 RepID=UPI00037B8692|nr:hypothetical protein [Niabella aurantiaca]